MALRIVNETGNGHQTKIIDTQTGEDLTAKFPVGSICLDLEPDRAVFAHIIFWQPQVDITVENALIKHVCPYCGHQETGLPQALGSSTAGCSTGNASMTKTEGTADA